MTKRRWAGKLMKTKSKQRCRRRLRTRFERLETRWLLSADLGHDDHDHDHDDDDHHDDEPAIETEGGGFVDHHAHEELPDFLVPETSGGGDIATVHPQSVGEVGTNGVSANLWVTDAYVRNGLGNEIASPFTGQMVAIQLHYQTRDLPFGSSYTVHYTVNGVTLNNGTQTLGAGRGLSSWYWWRGGWYASPGTHTVEIHIDPFNQVVESDETDNIISFEFTTETATSFPQPLIWPVEGNPQELTAFTNYVDVNPLSGVTDFNGGSFSYNGHNAWDFGPGNFYAQDQGIEIYAAADGTVTATHDGEFDRQVEWLSPAPQANYVILDHGGGWTTIYWHLRRDSVRVNVGDVVQAGDILGYMGSSGISSGSHIHYGLRHHGFTIEPMYDIETYLDPSLADIGYPGDVKTKMHSGVTNYTPNSHIRERPSDIEVFPQTSGQVAYVWGYFAGLQVGDLLQYVWKRPDGSVFTTTGRTMTTTYSQSWWWWSRNIGTQPQAGEWTIEFFVDGNLLGTDSFEVVPGGAPELRIESEGNIVIDERFTPIDLGEIEQFGGQAFQTFTVRNHGHAPANIESLEVPRGFSIADGLASTIGPGQSDSFTLMLDASEAGYFGGEVRIQTDDADEDPYNFSVEGIVTPGPGAQKLYLGISERKTLEGTEIVGNVIRSDTGAGLGAPLVVTLTSGDTTELTVPATVTIPAGQTRAIYMITALDDEESDGDQLVEVMATSPSTAPAYNELMVVDPPSAPVVASVIINGGDEQRSTLEQLRVVFDKIVEIDDQTGQPFAISNLDTLANVDHDTTVSEVDGQTVVDFLFTSQTNGSGSLVDGDYLLQIDGNSISADGIALDGDGDDTPGGTHEFGRVEADNFFRMFGDGNGNGRVELFDFAAFRSTYSLVDGDAGYLGHFDSNANDRIELFDFAAFRNNFG